MANESIFLSDHLFRNNRFSARYYSPTSSTKSLVENFKILGIGNVDKTP